MFQTSRKIAFCTEISIKVFAFRQETDLDATTLKKSFPSTLRRLMGQNWPVVTLFFSFGMKIPPARHHVLGIVSFFHTITMSFREISKHQALLYRPDKVPHYDWETTDPLSSPGQAKVKWPTYLPK